MISGLLQMRYIRCKGRGCVWMEWRWRLTGRSMSRLWDVTSTHSVGIRYTLPLPSPFIPPALAWTSLTKRPELTGLRPPHSNPLRLHPRPRNHGLARPLLPHRERSLHKTQPRSLKLRTRRRPPKHRILLLPQPSRNLVSDRSPRRKALLDPALLPAG